MQYIRDKSYSTRGVTECAQSVSSCSDHPELVNASGGVISASDLPKYFISNLEFVKFMF